MESKDIISKATHIYLKKYKCDLPSFINFLHQKVAITPQKLNHIHAKIISYKKDTPYTKDDIKLFMHIISAVQLKGDLTDLSIQDLQKYQHIDFKKSKDKLQNKLQNQLSNNSQSYITKPIYQEIKEENNQEKEKKQSQSKQYQHSTQSKYQHSTQQKQSHQHQQTYQKPNYQSTINAMHQQYPSLSINTHQNQLKSDEYSQENTNGKSLIENNHYITKVNQKMNTIQEEENQSSTNQYVIDQKQTERLDGRKFMHLDETNQLVSDKVKITHYQKVSQDLINTIIKYHIVYGEYRTWRRYSQFQKLMSYLARKYEGIILPQMPPKEGIKGNFTYLLGLDQQFLNNRQEKLQQLLKRLLNSKFVEKDQVLDKFLTQENFQIDIEIENGSYLKALTEIAFNAKQIKDYGMAYYKYIAESKIQLNVDVNSKYASLQAMTKKFILLNQYRLKINANFQKRRQIINSDGCLKARIPVKTDFDNILSAVSSEIIDLKNLFHKYLKLKSDQSWLISLIQQKNHQPQKKQYQDKLKNTQERISKMEENLLSSMKDFQNSKQIILKKIGNKLCQWRWKVHP